MASNQDTLVTVFGGSGFLGRAVVRALAKRDYRLRVAVRRPELAGHLQPLGKVGQIHAVQANLRYPASVEAAMRDSHVAINLVGISASIQFTDDIPANASLFPQIVTIPMTFFFGWCYAAVAIKRLHDRARSGWWLAMLLVAPFLLNKFSDWLDYGPLAALVSVLDIGVSVWCFVELFCLRGTRGPNRFGSDPLAPVAAAAPAEMRPLWDQQSELEFVRRGAGPSPGEHVKRGHD